MESDKGARNQCQRTGHTCDSRREMAFFRAARACSPSPPRSCGARCCRRDASAGVTSAALAPARRRERNVRSDRHFSPSLRQGDAGIDRRHVTQGRSHRQRIAKRTVGALPSAREQPARFGGKPPVQRAPHGQERREDDPGPGVGFLVHERVCVGRLGHLGVVRRLLPRALAAAPGLLWEG